MCLKGLNVVVSANNILNNRRSNNFLHHVSHHQYSTHNYEGKNDQSKNCNLLHRIQNPYKFLHCNDLQHKLYHFQQYVHNDQGHMHQDQIQQSFHCDDQLRSEY